MLGISDEILLIAAINNLHGNMHCFSIKLFNSIVSHNRKGRRKSRSWDILRKMYVERVKVSQFDEYTTVLQAPLRNCHYEAFESTISFLSLRANYAARWNPTFIPPNDGVKQCPSSHNLRK